MLKETVVNEYVLTTQYEEEGETEEDVTVCNNLEMLRREVGDRLRDEFSFSNLSLVTRTVRRIIEKEEPTKLADLL